MAKDPFRMPQPLGIFSAELLQRSVDYIEAFERLVNSQGRALSFPMYFLFVHGLEVRLKSYLAAKEMTKAKIYKLNHDLTRIYDQCMKLEMPFIPDLDLYIATFQEMNRNHDFRYPSSFILSVPPPKHCLKIARALRTAIAPAVSFANVTARVRLASDTRHRKARKIQWSD